MNENDGTVMKGAVPVICPKCNHTLVVELSLGADLLTDETAEEVLKIMKGDDTSKEITTE